MAVIILLRSQLGWGTFGFGVTEGGRVKTGAAARFVGGGTVQVGAVGCAGLFAAVAVGAAAERHPTFKVNCLRVEGFSRLEYIMGFKALHR